MLKKSLYITLFFILSGILGFLCQVLYAKYFGAGPQIDLFFALHSIPTIITGIAPVIFASVFIPIFAEMRQERLLDYIAVVRKRVVFFSLLFSLVGGYLTYYNLDRIYPGALNGETYPLAVGLCLLFWTSTCFSLVNGFWACVHNYFKRFVLISVIPLLVYIGIIVSVLMIGPHIGVLSVALGMTAATIVQFIIYRIAARQRVDSSLYAVCRDYAHISQLSGRILLITASLLPFTAFGFIAYQWGGILEPGAVSYLGYAHSFSGFLSVAASMGLATVSFPDLAKELSREDPHRIRVALNAFERAVRMAVLFILVISIFTIVYMQPVLQILLQRGKFGAIDIGNLARVMPWYFLGGLCIAVMNLVRNVFYSAKLYVHLAVIGVGATVLFVCIRLLLSDHISFVEVGMVEFFCLLFFALVSLVLLRIRYACFNCSFYLDIFKYTVVCMASCVVAVVVDWLLPGNFWTVGRIVVCGTVYMAAVDSLLVRVLRNEEIVRVNRILCYRLRRLVLGCKIDNE